MTKSERKDLGYLGEEFQKKLVHAFMEDRDFFKDLVDITDQNMFTNVLYRTYVCLMKNYYETYEVAPSYQMMDLTIREKISNPIELETQLTFNEELKNTSTEGVEFVKEVSTRFFKQQKIVSVANQILKLAGNGDIDKYDECVELLNQAITVGEKEDVGERVFDNLEETLSDEYRVTIPTGVDGLDKVLEGGIGKGELGVIIGSSGFGKTSLTTSFAQNAALNGFKVLQIVFEDRIKQIQRKHLGKLTQIEARNLSKDEYIDTVKSIIESSEEKKQLLNSNLRIVRFPSGEITASFLERYIKKLINLGFSPDLVVIDYFECLAPEKTISKETNEFSAEGKTMRKLEALAGKLNIAFWIPSQGTKDSVSLELVTMDKIGGSIKKAQIAHIIISIARSIEDSENNIATLALLKNRAGKSGAIWEGIEFNNGTCTVNTDKATNDINFTTFTKTKEQDLQKIASKLLKSKLEQNVIAK